MAIPRNQSKILHIFEEQYGDHRLSIYIRLLELNPIIAIEKYQKAKHEFILCMLKASIEFGNRNPQLN